MNGIILNGFIIILFVLLNPVYALFICAILNFSNIKINFSLFSILFSLSFCLLYFLKDYTIIEDWTDFAGNLNQFKELQSSSWHLIIDRFLQFPAGNEPLFWYYVKFFSEFISKNNETFVFTTYFLNFLIIAYLGKVIDEKYYIIIITCLLFTNYGIINNVQEIWRH